MRATCVWVEVKGGGRETWGEERRFLGGRGKWETASENEDVEGVSRREPHTAGTNVALEALAEISLFPSVCVKSA